MQRPQPSCLSMPASGCIISLIPWPGVELYPNALRLQTVGSAESFDQYECLSTCSDTPDCTWFSSDENSGFCGLFATCDDISTEDCAECISGEYAVQYRPCRIRKSPDTPQGKSAARQQQHTYLWLAASQEEQLILAR